MLKRAGRYEIVAELGHGGFGQVYRAFDPQLDSMVAVKTLSVDNDAAILVRFRNEAAASRRLRHPNIVTIYDFGEQDGTPYIVMELLEGQDLKRTIDSRKALPLWHKIQIMTQVASGLAHAHANGIVHRDVKPANVMLLPDGNVKIMDFGIALVSHDTHNRVTPKGAVIGTFRYLAPEQFRGMPQDARGDIFAYGLMFYELLSGVHPFHSQEDAAVMYNILSLEPVPIHEVCPGCPEQLQPVIARLLQKDPEFRYQNLEDVLFDCEPVLLALKRAQAHGLFEEAKLGFANRQLEGAQTLLRQAMEFDPTYPGARELREQLQAELRRVAVRPRIEALANEGRELLAAGNPTDAVQKYEAAVRLDPTDTTLRSSLDEAKATLKQSREVARLVSEAERALSAGDLTNAHRIAQQAAEMAPAEARSRDVGARVEAALAERERQAQLAQDLARVRRLIEIRSWDEASPLLDRVEHQLGWTDEIRGLRETLERGRIADERQRKLASGLASARQQIQAGSLESARDSLDGLRAEFPEAAEVEQLFQYAISEIEARKRSDVVDRALHAARALADRSRFADAARVLQWALLSYPTDPVLQRELRSVSAAQQQAERDAALSQALDAAKALQKQGRFVEALAPIEAFCSQYGSQAEVEEVRQAIERDRQAAVRAAEVRDMVRRVNDLLLQGNAQEATRILQRPPSAMEGHPELTKLWTVAQAELDRQLERAAALEEALAGANALRQQADFDEATRRLAAFTSRYGADPKVAELERSIQADREEWRRREEERRRAAALDEALAAANALRQQADFDQAARRLAAFTSLYGADPKVAELERLIQVDREELRRRGEEQRRAAALDEALAAANALREQADFDQATRRLAAFRSLYGADPKVAELERLIQADREELRRREEEQRRLERQMERDAALKEALAAANALREQADFDQATRRLAAFTSRYGADPKVSELERSIQADREELRRREEERRRLERQLERDAALKEALTAANALRQQADFDQATRRLAAFTSRYGADPKVLELERSIQADREELRRREEEQRRLERQRERDAALKEALAAANALRQQADFDQATHRLAAFTSRYGADPKVSELERSIQADREESRLREEELRRLVGRATEFLAAGKAFEATQILATPPSYFKEHPDVTRLRNQAEIEVRKQAEREAALQAAFSSAASFEQQGRFEDALGALAAFVGAHGPDGRISAREEAVRSKREEARLAAQVRELATRARNLLEQGNLQAAVTALEEAPAIVAASGELRGLLKAARAALAAQQTREAVAAILAEARACLRRDEVQGALDVLDRGLKRFPLEPTLESARAEAVAIQAAQQREEYCAQAVADIDSLIIKHEYGRASSVLAEALRRVPGDPRLVPLTAQIEAHRREWEALRTELKIRDEIARASAFLPGKPAEAVALLERLSAEYPGRPELAAPLAEAREAVRRAGERSLIQEAERLCDRKQFTEAAAKLSQAGYDSPELQAARQNVEARRAAVENERIAKAIESARETARRDAAKALRALEKLQLEFSHRPEIGAATEECRAAIRDRERQTFITEIEGLRAKGKFSKARARHGEAVARLGTDAGLAELLARIEASAAAKEAPVAQPARQPERPPARQTEGQPEGRPSRPGWIGVAASVGAVAILGVGAWVLTHRPPPPPPAETGVLLPVEILSDPTGASVQVGTRSCVTPNCRFDLPPGRYNVQAKLNGYTSAEQMLVVDATSRASSVDFILQPLPPPPPPGAETGTLVVQAGLPDVLVSVDDQKWRTDASGVLKIPLEAKAYRIKAEKSGYQVAPPERQVRISKGASQSIVFSLTPLDATLELRGAPAGWDISAGGVVIGRTDGSSFSKPVKPGDQTLRVSQGSASRELQQRFEPGGIVTLDWASVAPVVITRPPPPPPPDPAEQDWIPVSTASDPAQVQKYLDKYPNGAHAAAARTLLEALTWQRVKRDDAASLREYITRFPGGAHTREASAAIDDLVWKSVDQKNEQAVRAFVQQNPNNPHFGQAQDILDAFDKQKRAGDELAKELAAKQENDRKKQAAERKQIVDALDRFNAAFAHAGLDSQKQRALKTVWPSATKNYLQAVAVAGIALRLENLQPANITDDMATVLCTQVAQGAKEQSVKITLRKQGSDWIILSLEANR